MTDPRPVSAKPLRLRSIRIKIVAVAAVCALLVVVVVAGLVGRGTMVTGREQLRGQALDQLEVAVAANDLSGVVLPHAYAGRAKIPEALQAKQTGVFTYFDGQQMWATRLARSGGESLTVRLSAEALHAQRKALQRTFALAALIAILLACLVGWLLAGTVTARLRGAAQSLESRPDLPVPESGRSSDEVTVLVRSINDLRESLHDAIERERAFTADVAHELRTPLTVLVNAAGMVTDDEVGPLLRRQTQRLRDLVESLLALARAQATSRAAADSPVELGELANTIVRDLDLTEYVSVVADEPAPVSTDPLLLRQLLTNLIANAHRHGRPPVEVSVGDGFVMINDHGPGYPQQLLDNGPQRFATHGRSGGSGLGLTIAAMHARLLGATLTLVNTDDGACATVRLPRPN